MHRIVTALTLWAFAGLGSPAEGKNPPAARKAVDGARAAAKEGVAGQASGAAAQESEAEQEIVFDKGLVIEGKVEKPQVQFTLLKEPPPRKELRFEAGFAERMLEAEREGLLSDQDFIRIMLPSQ